MASARKALKRFMACHASRWRSTRHIEAHLRFPGMDFHEALSRVTYHRIFGVWPDLETPRTLSEKMCWLKRNDRRPENALVTDKWRMRGYVASLGLGHLLNGLHGVWDAADEIDFRQLPDAYALKVTNGSAWNIIKRPGVPLDERAARRRLDRWVRTDMSDHKGEWYYAASPSRIIAEHYLDNGEGFIADYKLFVFNGAVRVIQYFEARSGGPRLIFMSPDWTPMPFGYVGGTPFSPPPPRPSLLGEMREAAETLAAGFPLMRVDFHIHAGRLIVGELTLCPRGGYMPLWPDEWNRRLGDWLDLRNAPAPPA